MSLLGKSWCLLAILVAAALVSRKGRREVDASPTMPLSASNNSYRIQITKPEKSVRLVNGTGPCVGSVELHHGGKWQPLCRGPWGTTIARVLCRELDCGMTGDWLEAPSGDTGLGILQNGTEVGGAAAVPKWMAARFLQVDCTDSVRFLRNCSVNRAPCPSESAAVLNCRAQQGLRLVGGNSRCAGRVEIEDRHGGSWGTVCDDSWDRSEGLVVCRQLGCGSAIETLEQAHFGQGNGPIFLDEMDCEGSEASLWDCPAQRSHDCGHKEDAGVVCSEHREFRLSGGWDRCAGRVEVFYQGAWGTVCNSNWFNEHADLLCHSLGCNISESRPFFQHTLQNMVSFLCSEYKGSLWDCQKFINDSKLCNQSEAAGVICEGSLGLMAVLPVTEEALPFTMRSGLVPGGDPHGNSDVSSSGSRSLLIACIVLAMILSGTLLVCGLAIFWTSRKHSMATRDRREANLSGQGTPVLLNHSLQASTLPPTERNDYGDSPAIAPIIHVPAAVPGPASGKESDSDYEDYDFSTKPPTALSTFYNSLRYRPIEDTVQQNTVQMETLQEDTTASKHWRKQGDTVSTSSEEDYGNSTPRAKQNYNNSFPYLGDSEVPSAPSNPSCTGIRPPSLGGFGYPAPSSEGQGHRGPDSSSASLEKGSEPEHLNNRLSAATLPTRVPALRKHWGQGHRGPDSSSASLEKGPEPEDLNNRLSAAALPMHIPAPRKHYTESIEDSSSTSSGEEDWYQNWKPPPRSPAPVNQQPSSGSPSLAVTSCPQEESSEFDYDDIVSNKS